MVGPCSSTVLLLKPSFIARSIKLFEGNVKFDTTAHAGDGSLAVLALFQKNRLHTEDSVLWKKLLL